jgi:hypothetical protein
MEGRPTYVLNDAAVDGEASKRAAGNELEKEKEGVVHGEGEGVGRPIYFLARWQDLWR